MILGCKQDRKYDKYEKSRHGGHGLRRDRFLVCFITSAFNLTGCFQRLVFCIPLPKLAERYQSEAQGT